MNDLNQSQWTFAKADTEELQELADACGRGDADAMLRLSEYMQFRMPKAPEVAGMWLVRAAIYGNETAQAIVKEKKVQTPNFFKRYIIPYENFLPGRRENWYSGTYPGKLLNALGLLAFRPEGMYSLTGIGEERFLEVWEENGYDPPDGDGFGEEEYYKMFCLDEFFQPLPGVPMMECASSRDIRYGSCKKRHEDMLLAAGEAVGKREKKTLWTDF